MGTHDEAPGFPAPRQRPAGLAVKDKFRKPAPVLWTGQAGQADKPVQKPSV